jgi:hypothetical protein
MADLQLTPEHGGIAAAIALLSATLGRLVRPRKDGEGKAEKDLRELREQLAGEKLKALEERLTQRIERLAGDILRENGAQAKEIETLHSDINALWREHRAEAGREK